MLCLKDVNQLKFGVARFVLGGFVFVFLLFWYFFFCSFVSSLLRCVVRSHVRKFHLAYCLCGIQVLGSFSMGGAFRFYCWVVCAGQCVSCCVRSGLCLFVGLYIWGAVVLIR